MNPIIELSRISVSYVHENSCFTALNNVSLVIPYNSILGIIGDSGIGKTSLLRAMLCEKSVSVTGKLYYNGRAYFDNTLKDPTVFNNYFYVPQFTGLSISPVHTIGETFSDISLSRCPASKKPLNILRCELDKLDLPDDIIKCYPHELSGGMLQRALMAIAFSVSPKILLLDEPTSALDWKSQQLVTKRLKNAQIKENATIIVVSHDKSFLRELNAILFTLNEAKTP